MKSILHYIIFKTAEEHVINCTIADIQQAPTIMMLYEMEKEAREYIQRVQVPNFVKTIFTYQVLTATFRRERRLNKNWYKIEQYGKQI